MDTHEKKDVANVLWVFLEALNLLAQHVKDARDDECVSEEIDAAVDDVEHAIRMFEGK